MFRADLLLVCQVVDYLHAGQIIGQSGTTLAFPAGVATDGDRGSLFLNGVIGLIEQPRLFWWGLLACGAELAMTQRSDQLFLAALYECFVD